MLGITPTIHTTMPLTPSDPAANPPTQPPSGSGLWQRLGVVGPMAVAAMIFPALGGFLLLGSLSIVGNWMRENLVLGLVIYILGFVIMAGLALLPTYAQALLAGWAFGITLGLPAALLGFTGASILAMLIARATASDRLAQVIESQPKWQAVYQALLGRSWWRTLLLVTLMRLPPNSPFALTNLVLSSARVPTGVYVLGTLIGMTPRTALAVTLGAGLTQLDFNQPLPTLWLVVGFAVSLTVVLILGSIAQRALRSITAGEVSLHSEQK